MIDYDNDLEVMTMGCDHPGCQTEEEFDGTFQSCIMQSKDSGWRTQKNGDEWNHYCFEHA